MSNSSYKDQVGNVRVRRDLLSQVSSLPLPAKLNSTTKKVDYLLRLGVEHVVTIQEADAKESKTHA